MTSMTIAAAYSAIKTQEGQERKDFIKDLEAKLKDLESTAIDYKVLSQKLIDDLKGVRITIHSSLAKSELDYLSLIQEAEESLDVKLEEGTKVFLAADKDKYKKGTPATVVCACRSADCISVYVTSQDDSFKLKYKQVELPDKSKNEELLKQYEGKGDPMKLFIEDMYSEDLQMREYYITARERFFSEAITKLKEYGFSYKEVSEYFRKRLGYNDDFEKILIRSAEGEKNA